MNNIISDIKKILTSYARQVESPTLYLDRKKKKAVNKQYSEN